MRIGFIDVVGLVYNGETIHKRGLGGSESAVILMAEELSKLGHDVTVHCDCQDKLTKSGTFNDVLYMHHSDTINTDPRVYDVVVSVRSVKPFFANNIYAQTANSAKYKVLWMHDTFCEGDAAIEDMLNRGFIDKIFTLSDFHTNYVLNAEHGNRRNYEVLKDKVFQTRNGIRKWRDWIPLDQKDPDRFVYNASVTKGMVPLLGDVWPRVKERIPNAKLDVIGGFYRFREDGPADEQEKTVRRFMETPMEGVTMHGVITQKEVSDILTNASFMIYPPAFPETFGISTLEALYHRVPVITSNFGALEETAIDKACYKMNYAIEPNGLFPHINKSNQVHEFVNLTIRAHSDKYLLQQKQNYCAVVDDICTWDTVAIEWDRHFHHALDTFFPRYKYIYADRISEKVKRVYGRRTSSTPYFFSKSSGKKNWFTFVCPTRNSVDYTERNMESILSQDYDEYNIIAIDDNSNDGTKDILSGYSGQKNIKVIYNDERYGAARNQHKSIRKTLQMGREENVIVLLDGDDWLIPDNCVLDYLNSIYNAGYDMTYGSMMSRADNIPLIAQTYPPDIIKEKTYKEHRFNWGIPYTHLRTFRASVYDRINTDVMKTPDGRWMMSGHDNPQFLELIKNADKHYCNKEIVCVYNDANPNNDFRINGKEQNINAGVNYD